MQRKIILLIATTLLLTNVNIFAKTKKTVAVAPSAKVTDSDVKLFAEQFPSIIDELDAYGEYDEDATEYKDTQLLREILVRHGFEEKDGVEKFNMIMLCMSKMKIEKEIENIPFFLSSIYEKQIKKELNQEINPDDEKVVRRNEQYLEEKLAKFFEEEN